MKLIRRAPGVGKLEVYFDTAVSVEEKIIFSDGLVQVSKGQTGEANRLRGRAVRRDGRLAVAQTDIEHYQHPMLASESHTA